MAAVNNYSVVHSCFVIFQNDKSFTLPLNEDYLKLINLNEISFIYLFYILKKNNSDDFKFPYQGTGKTPVTQILLFRYFL